MSDLWLFFLLLAKVGLYCGFAPAIAIVLLAEYPYVYRWSRYLGMPVLGGERKGQRCRVLVRGARNSALIEFPDGYQAITSRNALRRCR